VLLNCGKAKCLHAGDENMGDIVNCEMRKVNIDVTIKDNDYV